jgi:hypothetical protein
MKLAIKGHKERGKDVLNLLKSLGGKERDHTQWSYEYKENLYYINKDGEIDYGFGRNTLYQTTHKIYTLEEFEELYPFKVGDKVHYTGTAISFNKDNICTITGLHWNHALNQVFYILDNRYQCSHLWIAPTKQKELKDYLKPGYIVEYDDGSKFVITQDVHGNNFGLQIGAACMWADLISLHGIVKAYQIDKPGALHKTYVNDTHLTLVWEKPKEVELTMQQIADKFGVDVNQLKIKK